MSRQSQASVTEQNRTSRPKDKPVVTEELTDDLGGLAQLSGAPIASVGAGTVQVQAAQLSDRRMDDSKRRALATQIGQTQGNQHLQRVVALVSRNKAAADSAPGCVQSSDSLTPSAGAQVQLSPDVVEGEETREVAGMPPGVHDTRTAIHYARARRMFRVYAGMSNQALIQEAERLNTFLLGPCTTLGPEAQAEFAQLLIDMERELSQRLVRAPMDSEAVPILEGVTWEPGDPLAGHTDVISPFHHYETWVMLAQRPTPEEPERPRRTGTLWDPTAVIYYAARGTGHPAPAESRNEVVPGDAVWVYAEHSDDPQGEGLEYQWQLRAHPEGWVVASRATLSAPTAERTRFVPDVPGRYVVTLTVTGRQTGLDDSVIAAFVVPVRRPEPSEEPERRPPPEEEGTPSWDRAECALGEIAGVPGMISGGRYFHGAHATRHGTICYGRYDCATDTCDGADLEGNPVYTAQFNQGRDDQQAGWPRQPYGNVNRARYGGIGQDSRLYRAGVDYQRRWYQNGAAVRFRRP